MSERVSGLPEKWQDHLTFTVDECAKVLRISRGSAYTAVKNGEIPTVQIGRLKRVTRAALERLLAG